MFTNWKRKIDNTTTTTTPTHHHDDDKKIPHLRPLRPIRTRCIYQDKRFHGSANQPRKRRGDSMQKGSLPFLDMQGGPLVLALWASCQNSEWALFLGSTFSVAVVSSKLGSQEMGFFSWFGPPSSAFQSGLELAQLLTRENIACAKCTRCGAAEEATSTVLGSCSCAWKCVKL